jgi:hypothetical protein
MDLFQNLLNKISAPGSKPKTYTEGWITVPGKGRRWRDTKGNYYMQQPGAAPSFTNRLAGAVTSGWREADKRLGGWLPGGGVASPLTRAVNPPQPFPGRSQELYEQTGVKARFIDSSKTPTLVSRIAPFVSPTWGKADYANTFQNEIGIKDYRGGASPKERELEMHELGHINPADKKYYSYAGVLGRGLTGISDQIGNPALLEVAGGLAKKYLDASEEDRAERFTAKHAKIGGYDPPFIDEYGRSAYGNNLRMQGQARISKAFDPLGIVPVAQTKIQTAIRDYSSRGLVEEYRKQIKNVRENYIIPGKDFDKTGNPTFEYLEATKRLQPLEERLKKVGLDPFDFMN